MLKLLNSWYVLSLITLIMWLFLPGVNRAQLESAENQHKTTAAIVEANLGTAGPELRSLLYATRRSSEKRVQRAQSDLFVGYTCCWIMTAISTLTFFGALAEVLKKRKK